MREIEINLGSELKENKVESLRNACRSVLEKAGREEVDILIHDIQVKTPSGFPDISQEKERFPVLVTVEKTDNGYLLGGYILFSYRATPLIAFQFRRIIIPLVGDKVINQNLEAIRAYDRLLKESVERGELMPENFSEAVLANSREVYRQRLRLRMPFRIRLVK